jgi:hypothetical protein
MKRILAIVLSAVFIATVGIGAFKANALAEPLSRVRTYQVTCTTGPAKSLAPAAGGYFPVSAFKFKNGANPLFLGGSDVDASTKGYPYAASEVDAIDAAPGNVFCITTGGSSVVTVFAGSKG